MTLDGSKVRKLGKTFSGHHGLKELIFQEANCRTELRKFEKNTGEKKSRK